MTIREIEPRDIETLLYLIKEIADYEKLSHEVVATVESLAYAIFEEKSVQALFTEVHGEVIGYALYFYNFSSFVGKKGLYLEDIYIRKEFRHQNYGKRFFEHIIELAKKENCGRMEWSVLDWNKPAIDFYKSMGASPMKEWTTYRISF